MLTKDEEWFIKLANIDRFEMELISIQDEIDDEREKTKNGAQLALLDMIKDQVIQARALWKEYKKEVAGKNKNVESHE